MVGGEGFSELPQHSFALRLDAGGGMGGVGALVFCSPPHLTQDKERGCKTTQDITHQLSLSHCRAALGDRRRVKGICLQKDVLAAAQFHWTMCQRKVSPWELSANTAVLSKLDAALLTASLCCTII